MEKPSAKLTAAAAGEVDRISELPDGILHSVLRRIPCYKEIARTSLLSRRWRYLYASHPFVEVSNGRRMPMKSFEKFSEATVKRFSRDKLLRMQSLKIAVEIGKDCSRSKAAEQLLDLASKRKAEHVEVLSCSASPFCSFPFQLLSNSSTRFLLLHRVKLFSDNNHVVDDLPFSLNSLRSLHLNWVEFVDDDRILTNLIASSPVLETLELERVWGWEKLLMPNDVPRMNFSMNSLRFLCLRHVREEEGILNLTASCPLLETLELWRVGNLRKLKISNFPSLKKLKIVVCDYLEVIEIAASELRVFQLTSRKDIAEANLSKVKLIAPNVVEMIHSGLNMVDLQAMISKRQTLKSLTLTTKKFAFSYIKITDS